MTQGGTGRSAGRAGRRPDRGARPGSASSTPRCGCSPSAATPAPRSATSPRSSGSPRRRCTTTSRPRSRSSSRCFEPLLGAFAARRGATARQQARGATPGALLLGRAGRARRRPARCCRCVAGDPSAGRGRRPSCTPTLQALGGPCRRGAGRAGRRRPTGCCGRTARSGGFFAGLGHRLPRPPGSAPGDVPDARARGRARRRTGRPGAAVSPLSGGRPWWRDACCCGVICTRSMLTCARPRRDPGDDVGDVLRASAPRPRRRPPRPAPRRRRSAPG